MTPSDVNTTRSSRLEVEEGDLASVLLGAECLQGTEMLCYQLHFTSLTLPHVILRLASPKLGDTTC